MKEKENLERLLIVVDMVNGFIKEGKMADSSISSIIPEIKRLLNSFKQQQEGIAFIKDTHDSNCREFKKFPVHCLKDTNESQVIDELKDYESEALVYEKNSTSTMHAHNFLDDINRMKKLKEIIIAGCCTDICVMNLAIPLENYFDEHNKNIDIYVPRNAVETYNAPQHNRDEYNEMAFRLMEQSGIKLVKKYGGR